jgi:TolB-like protein/Tfp pilus assembly protein PilF
MGGLRDRLPGRPFAGPTIESLAVLPLENLSGDPEQRYFVEGMHEALITDLARISGLKRVIARFSVMRYQDTDKPLPEIARELEVEAVITGSVLRAGDRVRITVQLINAATEEHLWAERYEREVQDVLALHSDVARAVAREVRVALTPHERARLAATRAVDPEAYEEYLKGQYQYNKLSLEGWEAATGHFLQSIEKDPSYAPAHAMLSFSYSIPGYYGSETPPAVSRSRALAAAERAVALDDSLAEAHASLARVKLYYDWDWAAADRASEKGLRLNPNSTMALDSRAFFLSWMGRHQEAIDIARRAIELDPVEPFVNTQLAMYYFFARRYDEAIRQANKVLALEPDYRVAHVLLCYSYAKKGMSEEAAREEAQCFESPSMAQAWALAAAGKPAQARKVYEQILAEGSTRPWYGYFDAAALGEMGEKDRAFAMLEQAYQGRSVFMSVLKVDPRLDSLRDDPRFEDLLRRMNFPE